jgi:hypothetical protein
MSNVSKYAALGNPKDDYNERAEGQEIPGRGLRHEQLNNVGPGRHTLPNQPGPSVRNPCQDGSRHEHTYVSWSV